MYGRVQVPLSNPREDSSETARMKSMLYWRLQEVKNARSVERESWGAMGSMHS